MKANQLLFDESSRATACGRCAASPRRERSARKPKSLIAPRRPEPCGTRAPGGYERAVLALTRAMPDNWLGLRLAILFRRSDDGASARAAATRRCGACGCGSIRAAMAARRTRCSRRRCSTRWSARVLAEATCGDKRGAIHLRRYRGECRALFALSRSCGDVRTLAIEPQPGILERLRFHLAANPAAKVDVLPIALSDREGEVDTRAESTATAAARTSTSSDGRKDRASASPCHASHCWRCWRGRHHGDRRAEDRRGGRRGHRAGAVSARRTAALLPSLILIEDTRGFWGIDCSRCFAARLH